MNKKMDWNPEKYLKFENERNLPSIDLVKRIRSEHDPENILDIGCGPGNSSMVLLQRWPSSRLTGLDNSQSMIDKALRDYPEHEWVLADAHDYKTDKKFDLAFSNAAFQWIPGHAALIKKFSSLLNEDGILAVQLPQFYNMPAGRSLERLSLSGKWKALAGGCSGLFTMHDPGFYYDILSGYFRSIDMWKTDYIHIFDSHMSVFEMIQSTGMRPYLEKLGSDSERKSFEDSVIKELKKDYPMRKDGRVLFPFKRLFFIGYK